VIGSDSATLRLERTFDAPAEAVFDAWTNPEVLRRWWIVNPAWSAPVAEVDLRVGGAYRLSMRDPDAEQPHTVCGVYREVRRPERLVYTWAWEDAEGETGHTSTITVQFIGEGERTRVVLEHSGLESQESLERHGHGWEACLQSLGREVFS
jgi:uncharacterized protein YndB with AHSA1/START domain